ncbi:MAG: flagellar motor protein MotB [Alphaproteobacteria bacterium]|nr:flagellar motor protein MotB [Alphaproteobacteria bacterium]
MTKKRRPPAGEAPDEAEDWLVTYADAITLLMAFFVMLVSFSKIDLPMFDEVKAGIADKIGAGGGDTPLFDLEANLNVELAEVSPFPPNAISVGFDNQGVVIDFASGALFKNGTTDLNDGAIKVLEAIREQLREPPYDTFKIDIAGHTSNRMPPKGSIYPTNWELSASQAARIVREFIDMGVQPQWLTTMGYADTQPKVPNLDVAKNPIVENQKQNERISLKLHP